MKKIILITCFLLVSFSMNATSQKRKHLKNFPIIIIQTSCGESQELDGDMTWDEIFDYTEFMEDFYC
ncbi:MAG: hypothetical protein ACWIPJ_06860 [Polaribacter sp.]